MDIDFSEVPSYTWDERPQPSRQIAAFRALIPIVVPTLASQECHEWISSNADRITSVTAAYELFSLIQLAHMRLDFVPQRTENVSAPKLRILQTYWWLLTDEEIDEWSMFTKELCALEERSPRKVEWVIAKLQYSSPSYLNKKNSRRMREKVRRRQNTKELSTSKATARAVRGGLSHNKDRHRPETSQSSASHDSEEVEAAPINLDDLPHWSAVATEFEASMRDFVPPRPLTGITSPHLYAFSRVSDGCNSQR